jgi:hypothetical protein
MDVIRGVAKGVGAAKWCGHDRQQSKGWQNEQYNEYV